MAQCAGEQVPGFYQRLVRELTEEGDTQTDRDVRDAWRDFLATGANPWLWRVMGHPNLHVSLEELEERWDLRRLEQALCWCDVDEAQARARETED